MREQRDVQRWRGVQWSGLPRADDDQALQEAIGAILDEARKKAAQIIADAEAQAIALSQQEDAQTAASCEAILERARQEARALQDQAVAAARLEAQALHLKRREQLFERVFTLARERLASITRRPDYGDVARRLVREAVARLDAAELVVRADAQTRLVLDDETLAELGGALNVRLRAGEPLTNGVGVIVETADGRRRYDNTFEARLAHLQNSLRPSVYQILTGEEP